MIPFRPIPTPTKRKRPSLSEKLAACLVKMTGPDGGPLVSEPESKTVKQILACVEWDHGIAREIGGSDHPTNLYPLPVAYHVTVKTPADQKKIKKARHNRKRELAHREVMTAKAIGDDPPRDVRRHRIRSRPFPKIHRPMRSKRSVERRKAPSLGKHMREKIASVRTYEVAVMMTSGRATEVYSATSAAAARAEAWRRFRDCYDCTFRDFLRISKVRSCAVPGDDGYGYVRRNYGVNPTVGARARLVNEGPSTGLQGVVTYPGRSTAYVHVILDGQKHAVIVHPDNVHLVDPLSALPGDQ